MNDNLLLIVAVVAVALAALCSAAPPKWPQQYAITGSFAIPHAHLNETVKIYTDFTNKRQRISYYGATNDYIYLFGKQQLYAVNPIYDKQVCFYTNGGGTVTPMLPDLATYSFIGNTLLNGQSLQAYQKNVTQGAKTSVYTFYLDNKNNPFQFNIHGYDILFGSHYDHYVFYYKTYVPKTTDTDFKLPQPCTSTKNFKKADQQSMRAAIYQMQSLFPCDQSDQGCTFDKFTAKHKKGYKSNAEFQKRKQIYTANTAYIAKHNANKLAFQLAENAFTDMTVPEYRDALLLKKGVLGNTSAASTRKFAHQHKFVPTSHPFSLPTYVNWLEKGAVTPVKDQAWCGSCWSFSTTGAIEGAQQIATGKLISLSEQNLVDCDWKYDSYGCAGGMQKNAYELIIEQGGVNTEASYPYIGEDGYCHFEKHDIGGVITGYYSIPIGDEYAMQEAVARYGPVAVSIDASHASFDFYGSGVLYEPNCSNDPNSLDHAVLVVGYGTENGQDYWLVKNSWSTLWGDNGYIKMARNRNNNCGIASNGSQPKV